MRNVIIQGVVGQNVGASGEVFILDVDEGKSIPLPNRQDLHGSRKGIQAFGWGYGGEAPAVTAVSILAWVTGDDTQAKRFYMDFKLDVIANQEGDFSIHEQFVLGWMQGRARRVSFYEPASLEPVTENKEPGLSLEQQLIDLGYGQLREVEGRGWCGLKRYMYTFGLCLGLDETGMKGRICFDTEANAALFFNKWDGKELPEVGFDGCTAIK